VGVLQGDKKLPGWSSSKSCVGGCALYQLTYAQPTQAQRTLYGGCVPLFDMHMTQHNTLTSIFLYLLLFFFLRSSGTLVHRGISLLSPLLPTPLLSYCYTFKYEGHNVRWVPQARLGRALMWSSGPSGVYLYFGASGTICCFKKFGELLITLAWNKSMYLLLSTFVFICFLCFLDEEDEKKSEQGAWVPFVHRTAYCTSFCRPLFGTAELVRQPSRPRVGVPKNRNPEQKKKSGGRGTTCFSQGLGASGSPGWRVKED
jgi:hypothetical protein